MAGKPKSVLLQRLTRPGEGYAIDVVASPAQKRGMAHFSADLSAAPVPDRRFSADAVSVLNGQHLVKLLFAQKNVIGSGYLSLLVIQMSFDSIHLFLKSMEPLNTEVHDMLKKINIMGELSEMVEPAGQTVVLSSTMVVTGYSGFDACLDFYNASPFAMQGVNAGGKLAIEAVVRVNMPTALVFAMWQKLKDLAPKLPTLVEGMTS